MTNKEYLFIKEIIDRDIEEGKIVGLEEIDKYINFKLYDSSELDYDSKKDILNQKFLKFISNNFIEQKIKLYNIKDINKAIAVVRNINENSVCVYDIIGIDIVKLLNEKNVSITGILMIEQLLNTFGLSIYYNVSRVQDNQSRLSCLKEEYDELVSKIALLSYKQIPVPKSYYTSLKQIQNQIMKEDIKCNLCRLKL